MSMAVVALLFAAVVVKLADVQVLNPDRYVSLGDRQRLVSKVIPAGRGSIIDRNGIELALSLPKKSVFADPKVVLASQRAGEIATKLAPLLAADRDELLATITQRTCGRDPDGPTCRYRLLAHTVPDSVAAKISDLRLPGVGMFDEYKRYRPSGDVGRSLLGQVSVDGIKGSSGLERQYNTLLDGRPGSITYERRGSAAGSDGKDRGITIAGGRQYVVEARPGAALQLTVDRAMQYETEVVLSKYVAAARAKGGMAIVMRPGTGEILSMANVAVPDGAPRGDASQVRTTGNNLALTTVFEPGSVTKVITMAAALDAGLVTPATPIEVPDRIQVADHVFTDYSPHPTQVWSTTDILVDSSNVGTIKIAAKLGKDRIDGALRKFGLGSPSGLGFPFESPGLMLPPSKWSGTSIGSIPIGQGIAVTALQMLTAFNVVANDGVYVAPRLVSATRGTDGARKVLPPSTRRRVVSADTATKLRGMMAKVVSEQKGTGNLAAVPGYTVAGKTGTARKAFNVVPGDGYKDLQGNYRYVATFAGFVPAEKPDLSLIVVLDEPTGKVTGGTVSAPAFSELARYALRRYDIPPSVVEGPLGDVPEVSASAREISDAAVPDTGSTPAGAGPGTGDAAGTGTTTTSAP